MKKMFVYKDRCFCSADCKNKKCDRNIIHVPPGVYFSMSDFSNKCSRYKPKDKKKIKTSEEGKS